MFMHTNIFIYRRISESGRNVSSWCAQTSRIPQLCYKLCWKLCCKLCCKGPWIWCTEQSWSKHSHLKWYICIRTHACVNMNIYICVYIYLYVYIWALDRRERALRAIKRLVSHLIYMCIYICVYIYVYMCLCVYSCLYEP